MKDSQLKKKKKRYFKRKSKSENAVSNKSAKSLLKVKQKKLRLPQLLHGSAMTKVKKHESNLTLILIPVILSLVYFIIYSFNSGVSLNIQKSKLITSGDTNLAPYPVIVNSYDPYLSSKAAIVTDAGSQTILYEKNPFLRFSLASTTKIMTALTALDYYSPDSILIVKSGFVEGSGLNLRAGDRFYFQDLMYAMMLPSANDAAAAIADNYPGGREKFVLKMNEKALTYHLADTHFSDPVGLDDDGNYSTVVDLARLASIATRNKLFAQIVSTKQKFITNTDSTHPYNLFNLNKLLGFHGVNGIKTGTTEGAGEVLVTSADINNHTFVIVVMNSKDRFGDTGTLLNFISDNVQFINPKELKIGAEL